MQESREHRNRTQIVSASGRRATLRDNSRLLTSMFTLRLRMIFYFRWNYKRKWNIYTMYWRKGIFNIVRRVKSKIYTTLHSVQELVKNQIIHEGIIEFYRSYTESISKFFAKRTIGLIKKKTNTEKKRRKDVESIVEEMKFARTQDTAVCACTTNAWCICIASWNRSPEN